MELFRETGKGICMKIFNSLFSVCLLALLLVTYNAEACTLFAANGSFVNGSGSLIGKTNDMAGGYKAEVIKNTQMGFIALRMYLANGSPRGICGVNKHGLALVISDASHISWDEKMKMPGTLRVGAFLPQCKTVEEALKHTEFATKPVNFILADAKEIARVEVDTKGKWHVRRQKNGYLVQTNHYLEPELQAEQEGKVYKNSIYRVKVIESLMLETPKPLDLEHFKSFTQDNRIFKIKTKPDAVETMGTMAVEIKPDGDFSVYFRYKPSSFYVGEYKVLEMTRKEIFGK